MRLRPYSLADLARRRAAAHRDADLIESGWTPSAADLADAPFIDQWQDTTYPGTGLPALVGHVTGHPRLGTRTVWTSPIIARGDGWVRSEGRFYRLGERRHGPPVQTIDEIVAGMEVITLLQPPVDSEHDPLDDLPDFRIK